MVLKGNVIDMTNLIKAESKVMTPATTNYTSLVEDWIKFAQVKPTSVKAYTKGVKNFLQYLKSHNVTELSREVLTSYREYLRPITAEESRHGIPDDRANFSAATSNLYLTATKLFVTFLHVEKNILAANYGEHLKGFGRNDKHSKAALDARTAKSIVKSFADGTKVATPLKSDDETADKTVNTLDTSTITGKRNHAIYAAMTGCGLRCVEVVRADVGDLRRDKAKIFLHVQGKGRDQKDERVEVPPFVMQLIEDYLAVRSDVAPDSPLFASTSNRNSGGRLTTTSVSRMIKSVLRLNGIDSADVTAHSLRHTAANAMIESGVDIRRVQQVLRHKSVVVTERYLHDDKRYNNGGECRAVEYLFL